MIGMSGLIFGAVLLASNALIRKTFCMLPSMQKRGSWLLLARFYMDFVQDARIAGLKGIPSANLNLLEIAMSKSLIHREIEPG
jgi:hypothetical protein